MSHDFRRFSKGLLAAFVLVAVCGSIYGSFSLYRGALERRVIQAEMQVHRKNREQEAQQVALARQKSAERRAGASQPAPLQPASKSSEKARAHVKSISGIAFSPDGKFVSATVEYATTSQLMIWPATGGSTLYRHDPLYSRAASWFWFGKNQLSGNDDTWQFHKNTGFWQLEKKRRRYPRNFPGSHNGGDVRDFPEHDLRLRQTEVRAAEDNPFAVGSTLEAYALSSGVRLPLPTSLRAGNHLENVEPLARWGKAPLRLALWLNDTKPTPKGPQDKNLLEVWDARAKKRLWQKSFPESAGRLLVAGRGRWVVAVGIYALNPSRPGSLVREQISVFDASTGTRRAATKSEGLLHFHAVVSTDGKLLAVHSAPRATKTRRQQHYITVYELPNLRPLKKIIFTSKKEAPELAFSPDNRWLATENNGQIILMDWRRSTSSAKPQRILWF